MILLWNAHLLFYSILPKKLIEAFVTTQLHLFQLIVRPRIHSHRPVQLRRSLKNSTRTAWHSLRSSLDENNGPVVHADGEVHAQSYCDAVLAFPPLQRCNAMPKCAPDKTDVDAEPPMPATAFQAHEAAV